MLVWLSPDVSSFRYQEYLSDNAQRFNRIHVDDFHYLESLGQGAFGTIVSTQIKAPAMCPKPFLEFVLPFFFKRTELVLVSNIFLQSYCS